MKGYLENQPEAMHVSLNIHTISKAAFPSLARVFVWKDTNVQIAHCPPKFTISYCFHTSVKIFWNKHSMHVCTCCWHPVVESGITHSPSRLTRQRKDRLKPFIDCGCMTRGAGERRKMSLTQSSGTLREHLFIQILIIVTTELLTFTAVLSHTGSNC